MDPSSSLETDPIQAARIRGMLQGQQRRAALQARLERSTATGQYNRAPEIVNKDLPSFFWRPVHIMISTIHGLFSSLTSLFSLSSLRTLLVFVFFIYAVLKLPLAWRWARGRFRARLKWGGRPSSSVVLLQKRQHYFSEQYSQIVNGSTVDKIRTQYRCILRWLDICLRNFFWGICASAIIYSLGKPLCSVEKARQNPNLYVPEWIINLERERERALKFHVRVPGFENDEIIPQPSWYQYTFLSRNSDSGLPWISAAPPMSGWHSNYPLNVTVTACASSNMTAAPALPTA